MGIFGSFDEGYYNVERDGAAFGYVTIRKNSGGCVFRCLIEKVQMGDMRKYFTGGGVRLKVFLLDKEGDRCLFISDILLKAGENGYMKGFCDTVINEEAYAEGKDCSSIGIFAVIPDKILHGKVMRGGLSGPLFIARTLKAEEEPEEEKGFLELLNEKFNSFDPFNTTNPDYSWWVCSDIKALEELLTMAKITLSPGMVSYIRHSLNVNRHVLLGIYKDPSGEFFLIGLPSVRNSRTALQHRPARWVELVKRYNRGGYGGYWIYYINPENSVVMKAIMRG